MHPNYVCIPQSAKAQILRIVNSYMSVQGTRESDIKCTMNKSIKSIIESSMKDILHRSNELQSEFNKLHILEEDMDNASGTSQVDTLFRLYKEIKNICLKQQNLITDVVECILICVFTYKPCRVNTRY